MRIFSTEHLFKYPWERVSLANWIKYPNDITPHVVHVDYLSRKIDPITGVLHTERLLTCRQNVPAFISRLFGGENSSLFYEWSEVDRQGQTLTLRSQNLTFSNLLTVEETCRYAQTPEGHTLLRQEVAIHSTCNGMWTSLANRIEEWTVGRFHANAQKGRLALEAAVERIYREAKEQVRDAIQFFDQTTMNSEEERIIGISKLGALESNISPIVDTTINTTALPH